MAKNLSLRLPLLLTAASLTLALPTVGVAQADPAPESKCTIAIDPGHNGQQISPIDQKTGIKMVDYPNGKEDADVFEVAKDVKGQLESAGYKVVMLKDSPTASASYRDRVTKAEQANANLAISIHTTPGGSEVYPQVVGNSRAKTPGSSERVTFKNAQTADASKKASDKIAAARKTAEGTPVTVKSPNFAGRENLADGNITNIQLLAENTPWVYNELGVTDGGGGANGISAEKKTAYAKGLVAGIKDAVKCDGAPPATTPAATTPKPSNTGAPTSETPAVPVAGDEAADPEAVDIRKKVDDLMKGLGNPEQIKVNAPGRAATVYKEIKACGDKSKDDCDAEGTVTRAGNFYRQDATKIAAVAYELALAKTAYLSGVDKSGPFVIRGGAQDIVFKDKKNKNPREQVSEGYEKYVESKKEDDKYPSTVELLKEVNKVKPYTDGVTFYPVEESGKERNKDFKDRREIQPEAYLQQAATIVYSQGRFEKYSALKAAAEAKKTAPADGAPVSEREQATKPLDTSKLKFADGYELKDNQSFIDLKSEFEVIGDEWNIRERPDVKSKSIGKANQGDKLRVVGFDNGKGNVFGMTGTAFSEEYTWPDADGKSHKGTGWVYVVMPDTNKVAYIAYPFELHKK